MPPTADQYEQLIEKIDELSDELRIHRPIVERSNRRSTWALVVGILGAVGIFVGALAVYRNMKAIEHANDTRDQARMVACVQYNVDIKIDRDSAVAGLVAVLLNSRTPPATSLTADQERFVAIYAKAIADGKPYRICTPSAIAAYYENLPRDPALEP